MPEQLTLSERLAVESANGTLNPTRTPTIPAIPSVGDDIVSLKRTIAAIKQILDAREARSGSVLDKMLTLRDLLDSGAITITIGNDVLAGDLGNTVVSGSGGITIVGSDTGYSDTRPVYSTPPTATNLVALGAFRTVVLTWDLEDYRNHSYTEVWRASVDNLGLAALIGTSTANIYDDASGVVGSTYYYWVRAVNIEAATGAFNAVSGVSAGLLQVGNSDLGPLSVEAAQLAAGAVEAGHLAANSIAVGNIAVENGAINNAAIANLAVDTAKIADLAVSEAKIADLAVTTAKIADLTVTEAKIVDLAVGTAKIGNAAITNAKIGNLEVDDAKIASLDGAKINADSITANKILITGRGAALNDDPSFADSTAWANSTTGVTFATVTDGQVGETVLRSTAGYGFAGSRFFPITAGKTYRLQFWARKLSGTGSIWVRLHRRNSTTEVGYDSGLEALTPTGSWAQYTAAVTPEATAITGYISVEFNWPSDTADIEIQDLRLEEQMPASLIVEGTITTDRILVGEVTSAQNSDSATGDVAYGAATSYSVTPFDIVTLTTTGAPVVGMGWLWITSYFGSSASLSGVEYFFTISDGATALQSGRIDVRALEWDHISYKWRCNTVVPIAFRHTPTAGLQTYSVSTFTVDHVETGTGFPLSIAGVIQVRASLTVQENKV